MTSPALYLPWLPADCLHRPPPRCSPCIVYITWDPTQPVATRPLSIQLNGTWFTYGWDLTKNICEVYGQHGYIRTAYTYAPYGEVSAEGDVEQPIQWSSEFSDDETKLLIFNYRTYNNQTGTSSLRSHAAAVRLLQQHIRGIPGCNSKTNS